MSTDEFVEQYTKLGEADKQLINDLLHRLNEGKVMSEAKNSAASPVGALKGKIWMSSDFDEPLEMFKDYM